MTEQYFTLHKDESRVNVLLNLHKFLDRLPATNTWRIVVKRFRKDRTDPQNKAMWGVAYAALQKATGQGVNDWHDYMLGEYFGWVECDLFGRKKQVPARTTTTGYDGESDRLSTEAFAEYYNFIQSRAAEHGVFIPDPDPFYSEAA